MKYRGGSSFVPFLIMAARTWWCNDDACQATVLHSQMKGWVSKPQLEVSISKIVFLTSLSLPEFWFIRKVKNQGLHVRQARCGVWSNSGKNFLDQVKIQVLSSQLKCTWFDDEIPFNTPNHFADNEGVRTVLEVQPFRVNQQEFNHVTATKSTVADVEQVCRAQVHLSDSQKLELLQELCIHNQLFDGTQGCYPNRQFKIKLKPEAVPCHCDRPYPVQVSVRALSRGYL